MPVMIRDPGGSHVTVVTDVRNTTTVVVFSAHFEATDQDDQMDEQDDKLKALITKDELNLAEFPFALPCHRAPKDLERIEIVEPGVDKDGRPIQKTWTVHPSGYGLPLAIDEEVFLGLMHLLYRSDFRGRTIYFTQHSLFQILGWNTSQRSYDRLQHCLRRLRGSTIECKETFWDNKGRCFVDTGFSLIDSYALYRRGDNNAHDQPFISQVTFGEFIFKSFKDGFIKTLDLNLYLSLKSALARKLFRLLDKKRHRTDVFEIEMMRLANRLALTDRAYPSDVKKQLERGAHAELEAIGFLKSVRYLQRGRSVSIEYRIAPKQSWHLPASPVPKLIEGNPLAAELITRGITPDVAHALVKEYGEKRVADHLEVFDHLRSHNSFLVSKSPAGFLRASIEKDFAPPDGYVSRAERQRRKEEEAEARRRERELAKAEEQTERQQRERFEALWASLSASEREQLETEVLVTLNPFTRNALKQEKAAGRVGPAHATVRNGIAKLLADRRGLVVAAVEAPVRDLA